ncbi:MAG: hypothetical protein H8E84_06625 [Flavobacteriales bacterium]|nr:hypothetical protein [Flavobacteriales bacterium]
MLLNKLKTTSSLTIMSYIVFALLFWCLPIFSNTLSDIYTHSFFSSTTVFILGLLLPLLQSVGLNNLIYEKDVIKKSNLVLAPVFLLLSTPFITQIDSWVISFLLLFYLNILFSAYQKDRPFSQSFNANFLLGIIAVFYSNILLLFPLVIITSITFRNINWRIIFISIIGLMLPFLFYWGFSIVFDYPFSVELPVFKFSAISFPFLNTLSYAQISWYSIVFIILIFSTLELLFWMYKKSIRSRKSFLIIITYIILLLFIDIDGSHFLIVTPISIVVANFFMYSKQKKLTNILFFLLVLASVYYRISI